VWDLAHVGPWTSNPQQSGRNGPTVLPGTYTLRLTVGDVRDTARLVVRLDPRLTADGLTQADLREQRDHNVRVRDMVSEVNLLVAEIDAARGRLANAGGAAADTLTKLNELRTKLVTAPIRYSQPMLQAHINYLYGLTNQADQKIGRDAVERYRVLRRELDQRTQEARALLGRAVRAM
jgi:hypothetical protein